MSKQKIQEAIDDKDSDTLLELLRDENLDIRAEAAKGLGVIGDKEVLPDLKRTLSDDSEDKKVISNIILAIGDLGSEDDVDCIKDFLSADSWVLRHDAAIALGELGGEEAVHLLKGVVQKEDDEDIKKKAVEGLGRSGDEDIVKFLQDFIDDEDLEREVVQALRNIGSEETIEPLKKKLETGNAEIREKCIESLSLIGGKEVLEVVEGYVEDDNWRVREEVAKILGGYGDQEHISSLKDLLEDDKIHVKEAAIEGIGKLGEKEHVPTLEDYIEHPEVRLRSSVYMALGEIRCEDSVRCLLEAFRKEKHPRTLWTITENLGKIGKEFQKELKEELDDHTGDKQMMISIALGKSGDTNVLEDVLEAVEGDRWKTRQKAVETLQEIDLRDANKKDAKRSLKKLKKALYDNDKWVRAEAAKAFGDKIIEIYEDDRLELGDEVNSLMEKKKSEADEDVKIEAEQALDTIEEETDIEIS